MGTFIALANYTAQGIKAIKESPGRLDAARDRMGSMGVTIKDFYLTMGPYDIVTVLEAPDMKSAASALLTLGAQGNISTVTLAALTEDEFREVISDLG